MNMPIFEYHCNACDLNFEYLVMGKDVPSCPKCQSEDVNKLMSACGFVSKAPSGQTMASSAGSSACSGCSTGNCGTCGSA